MPRPALLVPPLLMLLASCANTPYSHQPPRPAPAPPPVVGPGPEARAEGRPESPPDAVPLASPAPPEPTRRPVPSRVLADGAQLPALRGLLAAADAALAKGDVELAAASLERAQRLAPQSAPVYQRLATVRLRQKRPAEAEQLARKALAFAGAPAQQANLWLVIANARQMRGLLAEAQDARARASALLQAATETP